MGAILPRHVDVLASRVRLAASMSISDYAIVRLRDAFGVQRDSLDISVRLLVWYG